MPPWLEYAGLFCRKMCCSDGRCERTSKKQSCCHGSWGIVIISQRVYCVSQLCFFHSLVSFSTDLSYSLMVNLLVECYSWTSVTSSNPQNPRSRIPQIYPLPPFLRRLDSFDAINHSTATMALDQWPILQTPPNISIPEPLLYDSYIEGNESDLNISRNNETHQDKTSSMVITFIYFMVCAVGLCGNTLVIYVILRYAKMKTVTNIYILNLAVADVLCMMSLPFIALQLALVHWPFGEVLCRLIMSVGGCKAH